MADQALACPIAPISAETLLSREVARCPYPHLGRLQDEAPVHQVEGLPWYMVTRFADCTKVLLNAKDFSSEHRDFGAALTAIGATPRPEIYAKMLEIGGARAAMFDIILHRDAPAHTRQRRLLNTALTARFRHWNQFVERQTARLLAALPDDRPFDWVADFAAPLPIAVIADILGMPDQHLSVIKAWSDHSSAVSGRRATDEDWLRMAEAMAAQREFFAGEMRKRLEHPTDDLVGALAAAVQKPVDPETGDEPLTFDEAVEMLVLVLIGGNETTTQLLAGMVLHLATDPGLFARLQADPSLVSNTVEEALRVTAPITTMMRFCVRDSEVGGVVIPKGSIVSVCYNQANRDPRMFDRPDVFDPERPNVRRHLAFSTGIHLCPGAPLARQEARATLLQLTEAFASIELTGPDAARYDMASLAVRGMTSLSMTARRRPADVEAVPKTISS